MGTARWNDSGRARCKPVGKWINYFVAITQLLAAAEAATSPIEGRDKESFVEAGWIGAERSKSFDRPGEFRQLLEPLDDTANGVWLEDFQVEKDANDHDDNRIVYTFWLLGKEYCNINNAQVSIKYFKYNADAFVFPCKRNGGSGEYCYLENPSTVEWKMKTFQLSLSNEIKIDMLLLSGGYIIFDQVIIEHDGDDENDDCKTTTLETTIGTEGTTNWETTPYGTTEEKQDTEATGSTRTPVTLPATTDNDFKTTSKGTTGTDGIVTWEAITIDTTEHTAPGPTSSTTMKDPAQIHIDIQEDIPGNGDWEIDCLGGYQELVSAFNCRQFGGVDIPEEELHGEKGFWTNCDEYTCVIKYHVQPEDSSFAARIYQTYENLTGISMDDGATWEFISGEGWVDIKRNLDVNMKVHIQMEHLSSDVFAVLDRLAINAELLPLRAEDSAVNEDLPRLKPKVIQRHGKLFL